MFKKAMIVSVVIVMLAVEFADAEITFFDNSNDFFQSTNIIHTDIFESPDEGFFPAEFDSFVYDGEGKIGHTTWRIDDAQGFNLPISSYVLYSPAVGIDFLKFKNPFSAIGFDFAAPYNFETIGNTIYIEVTEIDNQVTTYEYIGKDNINDVWEYYGFVSDVGISQIKVYNDENDGILDDNFVFDNVSNSAIVPIQDTTPPLIVEFSFNPDAVDVSTQDQAVTVTLRITDDLSGFRSGQVTFLSPSSQAVHGNISRISGDALNGMYQALITIPRFSETGIWQVLYVRLEDFANNIKNVTTSELAAMGFATELEVTGTQDTTPPSIVEFSFNPDAVDVSTQDQAVTVTLRITDDLSGFRSGQVTFLSPSSQAVHGNISRISGDALNGMYQALITIPRFSETGIWQVLYVRLEDFANNIKNVTTSELAAMGFATELEVTGTQDTTPPSIVEFSFNPDAVDVSTQDQAVTVTLRITDDLSGFRSGQVTFLSPSSQAVHGNISRISGDALNGMYQALITIPRFSETGIWQVLYVRLEDFANNIKNVTTSELAAMGFATELEVISFIDTDGDGIPDDEDACPFSDLGDTVVIDAWDSGVDNVLLEDGCTISDLISECADDAANHGEFVSAVSHTTNSLKKEGIISGKDKGKIQKGAAGAAIP